MTEITNNQLINLTRGDSLKFPIILVIDYGTYRKHYKLKRSDVLYFGVTEPGQQFENAVIKKRYTRNDLNEYGNVVIKIEKEDTLLLVPGVYYYSIKLKTKVGVGTVIDKRKFFIEE